MSIFSVVAVVLAYTVGVVVIAQEVAGALRWRHKRNLPLFSLRTG